MNSKWVCRALGEAVDVASGQVDPCSQPYSEMPHVGGENIESGTGRLLDVSTAAELGLTSGKYFFTSADILYSKIRPRLNKVATPSFDGICSADIYPLRPRPDRLTREFLAHLLRSDDFLGFTEKHSSRTNIPKINRESLLSYEAVLPPIAEQRRIAEVLDRAEALRTKRRAALAQLDTLTQSIFLDLFGDPAVNPRGFEDVEMRSLFSASPIFGTMIPASVDGGEWLALRVANIQDWKLDLSDEKFVDLPASAAERHCVKDGDLLMARAIASQDHLGKTVIAYPGNRKWAFDSHLMRLRFRPEVALPEFIRHFLMTPGGRQRFLSASRRSAVQFNINTKEIAALRIPIAPIDLQKRFVERVHATERLRVAQRASLAELDALFASLQHRAFRGEL